MMLPKRGFVGAFLTLALASLPWVASADVRLPPGMATDAGNAATPQAARANLYLHKNVTPEDFGAKGDGTTDDTAAINNAIGAALASGYSVTFLHKTYKVTSQITIDVGTSTVNLQSDGFKIILADAGVDLDGRTITT